MEIRTKGKKGSSTYQKAAVTGKKLEASKMGNRREKGQLFSKCTKT